MAAANDLRARFDCIHWGKYSMRAGMRHLVGIGSLALAASIPGVAHAQAGIFDSQDGLNALFGAAIGYAWQ